MGNSKKSYEKLTTEEKIEQKRKKTSRLFRDLPTEKAQFAEGLIYQFAVSTVTLERLVAEINAGNLVEEFRRENPALRGYNATIKSFTALVKSLMDLLPEKTQKQAGEELMNFAIKPPGVGKR